MTALRLRVVAEATACAPCFVSVPFARSNVSLFLCSIFPFAFLEGTPFLDTNVYGLASAHKELERGYRDSRR